jgi:hypothetical protein
VAGLRLRRPDNGAVILELTDRITRIFGTILISAGNVSSGYNFPGVEGTPWYFMRFPPGVDVSGGYPASTAIGLSGTALTWSNMPVGTQILVGVY